MTNRGGRGYGGQRRSGGQRSGGQRPGGGNRGGGGNRPSQASQPPGGGSRRRTRRRKRPRLPLIIALVVVVAIGGVGVSTFGMIESALLSATGAASAAVSRATAQPSPGTITNWDGTGLTATAIDPSYFATGACMKFVPSGTVRKTETVFIDAGHGGIDPGGTGQTSGGATGTESAVNLAVALDAMKILTGKGYEVVLDRTQQTTVLKLTAADEVDGTESNSFVEADLAARDVCANDADANLLIGIYQDAAVGDPSQAGSVTSYDAARPFAAENELFANLLQTDVLQELNTQGSQIPDDGVENDTGMGSNALSSSTSYGHLQLLGPAFPSGGFTTPSNMPGALIEPLYLTDPFEGSIAASTTGQGLIAQGMADAAGQYFAQTVKPAASTKAAKS
jgi:N-acetylmuramoyl-L-alanine amidase